MVEKKQMKIAVVGKSAAGKSAFIRSFSDSPELIDSVGDGQTTRCYTEYEFLLDSGAAPEAEALVVSKKEFRERRASRASEQMLKEYQSSQAESGIGERVRQELRKPILEDDIKNILLYDEAFFRINEFTFLDDGIVLRAEEEFEGFKRDVMRDEQEKDREEKKDQEWLFENLCRFYEKIYDLIINALKNTYHEATFFYEDENSMCFRFPISDKNGKLLSRLLKVDKEKKSLTGIMSKVRVVSRLNEKYRECIKKSIPNLESVTLIDTYGLDHSKVADEEILKKRYDDMLNRDYPDISAVFFVARLTHAAPSDFKEALLTLYRAKAEVMAYVVGTHIDENLTDNCDEEEVNWLYCGDKTKYKAPHLQGKIWEELESGKNLAVTLYRKGVPETLARKRCEVMRKRFAPFCGDPAKMTGNIDYRSVNLTSIEALFHSISLQEHLGEGIVSVAKIRNGISAPDIPEEFAERYIEEVRRQFKELYIKTWSRTRGKVRENLESYIMGFYGTTVNATWGNALRGAFWQTFSRESGKEGGGRMLSNALGMEEAEKVAFDEIMNQACKELVCPACHAGKWYSDEFDCRPCAAEQRKVELCIWNSFIRAAGFEAFRQQKKYFRVIDWLNTLHSFLDEDGELKREIAGKIRTVMEEWVIPRCEKHNEELIARNNETDNNF